MATGKSKERAIEAAMKNMKCENFGDNLNHFQWNIRSCNFTGIFLYGKAIFSNFVNFRHEYLLFNSKSTSNID